MPSVAQLDAVFRHAPNPIAVLDPAFTLLAINDALLDTAHRRREELIGANMFAAFPEDPGDPTATGHEKLRDSVEEVLRTRRAHRMALQRYDLREPGGEYRRRYWSVVNYPVLGAGGEVAYVVHHSEEVSELIAQRERLAGPRVNLTPMEQAHAVVVASEERLRRAMSIETIGVLFFSLDGRLMDANQTFLRMTGYSLEELRGSMHWSQLTPPEFMPVTRKAAGELATLGRTAPYEKEFLRKDGSRFYGLFAPTVLAGSGMQAECVEFIIDITESKRYEQALRDADRRKDEFLAILAHELRNPLAPLGNGLVLLDRIGNAGAAEVRAMMGRQLRHMVRLIDDLLDVSRITRSKIELKKETLNLADVVRQAVEATRPSIEAREHELVVRLPREPVPVHADATRLSQVVSNLLSNAAKYTSMRGRISVALQMEGTDAVLRVSDTGQGIAPEMLGKVFNLFTQVDEGEVPKQGGLGIGLSIVKGLVELHGGTVRAESPGAGRGSTFTVRLPLVLARALAEPSPAAVPAIGRRRILVVDDNVDAANSLAQLIKHAGGDTRVAYDGEEALAAAQAYHPEVILLDLGLPKKDGYEVCRAIRKSPGGDSPLIVALSGWGQEQDRRKSESAGFDAHLVKPADFRDVARVLASARH